jgi:predicted aspartyl protease
MIVAGRWSLCEDGMVRPVVRASIKKDDEDWINVDFLIDTGADRTVFISQVAAQLGLSPVGSRDQLIGLGGNVGSYQVKTMVRFHGLEGEIFKIESDYPVLTDPKALEQSLLGCDLLQEFALIMDRKADRIWLVTRGHQYGVFPVPL